MAVAESCVTRDHSAEVAACVESWVTLVQSVVVPARIESWVTFVFSEVQSAQIESCVTRVLRAVLDLLVPETEYGGVEVCLGPGCAGDGVELHNDLNWSHVVASNGDLGELGG